MDDHMLQLCMIILSAVIFLVSLYSLKFFRAINRKHHEGIPVVEPPGTTGWPIIGETLNFARANLQGIPEKFFYDRIRKYSSKVFKTSLIGETVVVLNGTAGNKFLFSNEYKLVTVWRPVAIQKIVPITVDVTSPSGMEESKKLRQKMYPSILKREALKKHVGIIDSLTRKHFDAHWDNKEETIVYPLARLYAFTVDCRLFLSVDDDARVDELFKTFNVVTEGFVSYPINLPGTPLNRGIKTSKVILKEFESIIKEKELTLEHASPSSLSSQVPHPPAQDMLSQMIMINRDDSTRYGHEARFNDNNNNNQRKKKVRSATQIAELILSLMTAGYQTSGTVITTLMKYLVEFPVVLREVLHEQQEIAKSKAPGELLNMEEIYKMKYSWNVVCEVMRLAPPLQGGFAEALTDFTYAGYFIPKGRKLYWTGISTHMNPEYFPDPEKFDPSRFQGEGPAPYTYVPFGGGPGMCPGYEYARVKILTFLHHVVIRYEWEKLIPGNERVKVTPFPLPPKGFPIRLRSRTI